MADIDFQELLRQALMGRGGIAPMPTARPDMDATAAIDVGGAAKASAPAEKPNWFQATANSWLHPDDDTRDERRNALLAAAGSMMASGAPSTNPAASSFLGNVGQGLLAGAQASNDFAKGAGERRKAKAAQEALQASQQFAATLGGSGDGSYSIEQLKAIYQQYLAAGEYSAANAILEKIQRLDDSAAQKLMVKDDEGNFVNAPGVVQAETQEEYGKAKGRVAGEESEKSTDDLRELDAVNADRSARGLKPLTPEEWINRPSNNKGTTVQVGENRKVFADKADEKAADRYNTIAQEGASAPQMIADMQTLADLGRQIQTGKGAQALAALGPYAEAVGIDIKGLGAMQAYQAITARLAPQMRPAGAGATSDFDAKQYLQSIPNLGNTAEGNQIINDTMTAIATNKQEAAKIANRVFKGEITWQQGDEEMSKLPNPYARFKEFQKGRIRTGGASGDQASTKDDKINLGGAQGAPQANEAPIAVPTVNTPADVQKLPPSVEFFYTPDGKRKRNPNYKG